MTMKYKLTSETKLWFGKTLYRIEALVSFGSVEAGERGGFVECEKNLDQQGYAWVFGGAHVYGNARVFGNACVYGNARVFGNACVYGYARVFGNACVYGYARVFGNAWVYGNACVYGYAQVSGGAQVYGNARVSPINIIGLYYNVTICDDVMIIGCEKHIFDDWRSFDNRRILEMDGKPAAKFWGQHRDTLMSLCDTRGQS